MFVVQVVVVVMEAQRETAAILAGEPSEIQGPQRTPSSLIQPRQPAKGLTKFGFNARKSPIESP